MRSFNNLNSFGKVVVIIVILFVVSLGLTIILPSSPPSSKKPSEEYCIFHTYYRFINDTVCYTYTCRTIDFPARCDADIRIVINKGKCTLKADSSSIIDSISTFRIDSKEEISKE